MSVWIVIPSYNESQVLPAVIEELLPLGCEIVVVDDGSSDGTFQTLAGKPVHRLQHVINLGQGAALQTGISYALRQGAEYIVTFDADGQHRSEDILKMLEPVRNNACDVTLGTRFQSRESVAAVPPVRRMVLRLATWFTRMTTGLPLTDTHNGIRALNRHAAESLHITQNRMSHASEILSQIARAKLRVLEVPVKINYSQYSLRKGQNIFNAVNILIELLRGKVR